MSTPEFQEAATPRSTGDIHLVISRVWQEKDPARVNGVLTKFRVEDPDGETFGVFFTPSGSRLSMALLEYARKRKFGR